MVKKRKTVVRARKISFFFFSIFELLNSFSLIRRSIISRLWRTNFQMANLRFDTFTYFYAKVALIGTCK